jgi:hypothetical protein
VSRVLRNLQEQRWARHERRYALLDYYIPLAQYEDRWDAITRWQQQQSGLADDITEEEEGTWAQPMQQQEHEVCRLIADMDKKSSALAGKMLDIVNAERELAEKEKVERRRIAWEKRQAKKGNKVEGAEVRKAVDGPKTPPTPKQTQTGVNGIAEDDALTELEKGLSTKKKP